ncbi:amino acid transporter heavy chain SLC3A1-like [Ptychodera flava]|uniref:amino acid transporter heavy chain SLC3A1-like n=1 Tax=Ptychodera flava TaxID=63121 RepID=UPI00396A8D7D
MDSPRGYLKLAWVIFLHLHLGTQLHAVDITSKMTRICLFFFLLCNFSYYRPGTAELDWWQTSVIYQIYPRSFKDSDGDGVGDLKGITSMLDHFADIHVQAIWLSPIYESPMADFGYDISNFTAIDPIFGTMEDFDEMIEAMHERGIRLIMDFIPNHSSDQHEWFLESRQNRTNDYANYYMWYDPNPECVDEGNEPEECPPNNWVSVFSGSAWEWEPMREQFYLHQFLKEQPDLNFRNQTVYQEMADAMEFWLKKGVDGFRVDAIKHLYEVEDVYQDEAPNPDYEPREGEQQAQYDSLYHNLTTDFEEIHIVLRKFRQELLDPYSQDGRYRFMVTEAYSDIDILIRYYGTDDEPEADFPYNFELIPLNAEILSGTQIHEMVDLWLQSVPEGRWPNFVLGNHDNSRIASRIGVEYLRAMNVMLLTLPGTPTTYYGEEIGMENIWVSYNDTQDPYAKNNPCCWEEYTRDPERSPMQWTPDPPSAGFSETNETWLPVNENYQEGINVEDQKPERDPSSTMALYKLLAEERQKHKAIQQGTNRYGIVDE